MKKREPGMAYNMARLNKVFLFLSLGFLMTTLWVFLDDYIRPWKAIQVEGLKIKRELLQEKVAAGQKALNKEEIAALEKELEQGRRLVAARQDKIARTEKEMGQLRVQIKAETIVNGRLNSQVSATSFQWEQAQTHGAKKKAAKLFKRMRTLKGAFAASKDKLKTLGKKVEQKRGELAGLRKELDSAQRAITKKNKELSLLGQALAQTRFDPVFALRNAPFIDFMDPTIKIRQVVMDNITDDRYFRQVPKVDRCMTCHVFIDKPGYEKRPNPFKTHPNLELMVGAKSPHPMRSYGCTSCHGGEGHRVFDFNAAAHTPRDERQKLAWIKKYNWHEPHKIPQPMHKVGQTEAGCIKCHQGVEFIPQAPVVNRGRRAMKKYGCFACHKVKGWERWNHMDEDGAEIDVGPSLARIPAKITKEFFKNWVWSPKGFNPHALMPSFFNQSNNKKEEFTLKNIAEVNAMAEYIWDKAEDYKPFAKYPGGNAERGKQLIRTVGCMGCHGVEGFAEESGKVDAYAGPYLAGTGSKIRDPNWLQSWLLRPEHYHADTIMPSFRLSKKEAGDIAAYLLSLKNKNFEELRFEPLDGAVRDELLVEYFSAFDTLEVAKAKLQKMNVRQRTLELGRRSIAKYGCYSCHDIKGFDGRAPIGPELTNIGSKPLTQFGFGHEHDVEHSRGGWIKAHLLNPRRWDHGLDKPFKDLLRMPHLFMSEQEAQDITVALLGQVSDYIPLAGVKRLDAHEKIAASGMKVISKYNCTGCHQIDGMGGDIGALYEDDLNEGPPWLVAQGERTRSDWLHHFLGNVSPIRPWLSVRMPSFNLTNEEKNQIVAAFQAKAQVGTFEAKQDKVVWEPGERAGAIKLFRELDCASCHTGGFNREEATAPDLRLGAKRLRPAWIGKWLADPHSYLEYTPMSNFWADGESMEETVFDGDGKKQRQALTKYILELGQKRR